MKIDQVGIDFIKKAEGFSPKLYDDVGHNAIGYGCDLSDEEAKQYKGREITEQEATALMLKRLEEFERYIDSCVKVTLTQNQFNALCSFCYNLGKRLHTSTLLKKLNAGDYKGAAEEFLVWRLVNKKPNEGVLNRRKAEKKLFETA